MSGNWRNVFCTLVYQSGLDISLYLPKMYVAQKEATNLMYILISPIWESVCLGVGWLIFMSS